MKKLKKIVAVAILISAMLALGACGDGYKEFDLDKCEEVALIGSRNPEPAGQDPLVR